MNMAQLGSGGFKLPTIYQKAQTTVAEKLKTGDIDYAESTQWTFSDEFLCFALESNLLEFVDRTYPNSRVKNEVPIWFIITCQFLLHINQTGQYKQLQYFLNAGSLLTRFGFNVGASKIGFNDKNKKNRKTVIDQDTVRKFFKDTPASHIRDWHNQDLQQWFRQRQNFNKQGIFILDQSHLVVPDNPNYKDAVKMPVDAHGQLYKNLKKLTEEQKKALPYHPCYALTTLLHVTPGQPSYHISGYELGPGNEDELTQAEKLIPQFCRKFPGIMKELIVDRGYISAKFIKKLKSEFGVDVIILLKKNMANYTDAISIAETTNQWDVIRYEEDEDNQRILCKNEAVIIHDMDLWLGCPKLNATVNKETKWDYDKKEHITRYYVIASTKPFKYPINAVERYSLRVQIEERFRQLKLAWYITDFPSPHASLLESHVCFTLFTYSLLQLYFSRNDLQDKNRKMISSLRKDEKVGKDAVIAYAKHQFAVFDFDDFILKIMELDSEAQQRLKAMLQTQREIKMKRAS